MPQHLLNLCNKQEIIIRHFEQKGRRWALSARHSSARSFSRQTVHKGERTGGGGRWEVEMDQAYVQGLRDAKALLDEGIFTEQEFMLEKETLLKQHEERIADQQRQQAAGGGRGVGGYPPPLKPPPPPPVAAAFVAAPNCLPLP